MVGWPVTRAALAIVAVAALAGCSGLTRTETVEVRVPVPVRAEPPAELLEPPSKPRGQPFTSPDDPDAVVGLTDRGRDAVVDHVDELRRRDRAWRAWATDDDQEGDDDGE